MSMGLYPFQKGHDLSDMTMDTLHSHMYLLVFMVFSKFFQALCLNLFTDKFNIMQRKGQEKIDKHIVIQY